MQYAKTIAAVAVLTSSVSAIDEESFMNIQHRRLEAVNNAWLWDTSIEKSLEEFRAYMDCVYHATLIFDQGALDIC